MKKAFTLIELLVVIAIIAILAAILFPVFAQAKLAAKKTSITSNMKQVSTAMFLYQSDFDDYYFRGRSCQAYSALNPAFADAAHNSSPTAGCGTGGFYNQVDHYEWQKYLMPYTKSVEVFFHPLREKNRAEWDNNSQIFDNLVINLGFTGLKSTDASGNVVAYGDIAPFTGGNQSGIPNVSAAALFIDNVPLSSSPFVPIIDKLESGQTSTSTLTGYPIGYREFWAFRLMKMTQAECAQNPQGGGGSPDTSKATAGGLTIGRADGSAKFMSAGAFLAQCPTLAQMTGGGTSGAPTCVANRLAQGYAYTGTVDRSINFPMWGFGN